MRVDIIEHPPVEQTYDLTLTGLTAVQLRSLRALVNIAGALSVRERSVRETRSHMQGVTPATIGSLVEPLYDELTRRLDRL